jgi:multiple antibiotic resistance protein
MDWINYALIVQVFILLNPSSSFPFLMSAYRAKMDVKRIAYLSTLTAFAIAAIIALIGPYLFGFFGITIDSFRIAGGLVLLLLGLDTIRSKDKEDSQNTKGVSGLVSIIATPMLTGPATISFITLKAVELGTHVILLNLIPAFLVVGAVFVTFSCMIPKINANLVDISSKVLGLFLTAVAIEMIFAGIKAMI